MTTDPGYPANVDGTVQHACCRADECRFDPACGMYPTCIRVDPPPTDRSRVDPLLLAYAVLALLAAFAFVGASTMLTGSP